MSPSIIILIITFAIYFISQISLIIAPVIGLFDISFTKKLRVIFYILLFVFLSGLIGLPVPLSSLIVIFGNIIINLCSPKNNPLQQSYFIVFISNILYAILNETFYITEFSLWKANCQKSYSYITHHGFWVDFYSRASLMFEVTNLYSQSIFIYYIILFFSDVNFILDTSTQNAQTSLPLWYFLVLIASFAGLFIPAITSICTYIFISTALVFFLRGYILLFYVQLRWRMLLFILLGLFALLIPRYFDDLLLGEYAIFCIIMGLLCEFIHNR